MTAMRREGFPSFRMPFSSISSVILMFGTSVAGAIFSMTERFTLPVSASSVPVISVEAAEGSADVPPSVDPPEVEELPSEEPPPEPFPSFSTPMVRSTAKITAVSTSRRTMMRRKRCFLRVSLFESWFM